MRPHEEMGQKAGSCPQYDYPSQVELIIEKLTQGMRFAMTVIPDHTGPFCPAFAPAIFICRYNQTAGCSRYNPGSGVRKGPRSITASDGRKTNNVVTTLLLLRFLRQITGDRIELTAWLASMDTSNPRRRYDYDTECCRHPGNGAMEQWLDKVLDSFWKRRRNRTGDNDGLCGYGGRLSKDGSGEHDHSQTVCT